MENCTVYEGHARFEGPRTVRVGEEQLVAPKIFINVGSRALVPPMPGLKEVDYLTNSNVMAVDFPPEHLIIIGGSYIGIEFGQMYCRFGSEVTVVEMAPRLIQRDDEDVSETVKEILENEGINIRLNAKCISMEKRGDKVAVQVDCDSGDREVIGSHLLLAVGRKPNTDDLGWIKPALGWINEATFRWTTNYKRTCLEYGPLGIATARARSRTRPTMISRSSRLTYWMTIRVGLVTEFSPMGYISTRHWDAPA